MNREIRIPKQKRSIEKKNKLIAAAYKLFNEKGYYNTNTAQIATEAGLSTGCLYDYFMDKDDIFMDAIKIHNKETEDIIVSHLRSLPDDIELQELIEQFISIFMKAHNHSKGFHREVMALRLTKPEIDSILDSYNNLKTIGMFEKFFKEHGVEIANPNEQISLLLNTIDSTCHDLIYGDIEGIDQAIYIKECARMLTLMLREERPVT